MKFYYNAGKEIKFGSLRSSDIEIRDLIKAWIAISLAFAIVGRNLYASSFAVIFIVSAFTVGIGFLLHELGHKVVAQRYGCFAEFRSFDKMLVLALLMSYFGFVFAAPGAVMIQGNVTTRKNGIISVAGPLVNIMLALLFLVSLLVFPFLGIFSYYGFLINSWLALFNMIPIGNFDGAKVLRWNKAVFSSVVVLSLIFMFLANKIRIT